MDDPTAMSNTTDVTDTTDVDDTSDRTEKTVTTWAIIAVLCLAVLLVYAQRKFRRNKGRKPLNHVIYIVVAILTIRCIPNPVHSYIFSPMGVALIGAVFPIYESVRAVCSPLENDDKEWLQYWIVQSAVYYSTEWVDDIRTTDDGVELYWHEFEIAFFVWMQFPLTDGSALLYHYVMEPFVAPLVAPAAKNMGEFFENIIKTMINAGHLWFLWFVFALLPAALKRFAAVSVGVVYPFCASVVAATTSEGMDDTYWLTYWSCYGLLFFAMDILETYFRRIPGFYTLVILTTVYLMLPMFGGSEKLFRKVLVPLAGLREMLLMRDTLKIKKDMLAKLPPHRAEALKKAIAESFAGDNTGDDDPLITYYFGKKVSNEATEKDGYQSINNEVV